MAKKADKASKHGTTVEPCSCRHAAQDALYGRGRRLHNRGAKARTCTVCGVAKANA